MHLQRQASMKWQGQFLNGQKSLFSSNLYYCNIWKLQNSMLQSCISSYSDECLICLILWRIPKKCNDLYQIHVWNDPQDKNRWDIWPYILTQILGVYKWGIVIICMHSYLRRKANVHVISAVSVWHNILFLWNRVFAQRFDQTFKLEYCSKFLGQALI